MEAIAQTKLPSKNREHLTFVSQVFQVIFTVLLKETPEFLISQIKSESSPLTELGTKRTQRPKHFALIARHVWSLSALPPLNRRTKFINRSENCHLGRQRVLVISTGPARSCTRGQRTVLHEYFIASAMQEATALRIDPHKSMQACKKFVR